jgi:hypothetical protein
MASLTATSKSAQPGVGPARSTTTVLDAHFIAGDGVPTRHRLTAVHHIFPPSTTGWRHRNRARGTISRVLNGGSRGRPALPHSAQMARSCGMANAVPGPVRRYGTNLVFRLPGCSPTSLLRRAGRTADINPDIVASSRMWFTAGPDAGRDDRARRHACQRGLSAFLNPVEFDSAIRSPIALPPATSSGHDAAGRQKSRVRDQRAAQQPSRSTA